VFYTFGKMEPSIWVNGRMGNDMVKEIYTWNDGGKYVGEYKNGQKNGHGTYTFPNGDNFEGEWKEGEQDDGTHTWSNKYKYEGSWKSGQMWNGIYYDNKGNLFGKQVNGKQQ